MAVKVPKAVTVLGHRYRIDSSKKVRKALRRDEVNGYCFPDALLIEIDRSRPRGVQRRTVLHEVLHACWGVTSLPDKHEEDVITTLSPILLDALRRSPEVVAFLMDGSEAA